VPLATVAPASGTNQGTGRKTRPHLPLGTQVGRVAGIRRPRWQRVPKGTGLGPSPVIHGHAANAGVH